MVDLVALDEVALELWRLDLVALDEARTRRHCGPNFSLVWGGMPSCTADFAAARGHCSSRPPNIFLSPFFIRLENNVGRIKTFQNNVITGLGRRWVFWKKRHIFGGKHDNYIHINHNA